MDTQHYSLADINMAFTWLRNRQVEVEGLDCAPEVARYNLSVYASQLPIAQRRNLQAYVRVNRQRRRRAAEAAPAEIQCSAFVKEKFDAWRASCVNQGSEMTTDDALLMLLANR